ncbi:hypothetical protein GEMRC1_005913 [Eukaryota sp. GEM-RC1]
MTSLIPRVLQLTELSLGCPLLSSCWVSETEAVVSGGGGRSNTGVPNIVALLRIKSEPSYSIEIAWKWNFDEGIYSLTSDPSRRYIALCTSTQCQIYYIGKSSPYFRKQAQADLPSRQGRPSWNLFHSLIMVF